MPARPIDAAEGYRLFVRQNGEIELDEINEYLRGLTLREVSPRMLEHYRRLRQHGYRSYVTINRFDIAVAGDYAWSEDLRAHYREVSQPLAAEAIWDARIEPITIEALGSASATATSQTAPPVGKSLVVRLVRTGIARTGTVIRHDPQSGRFHVAFDPYTGLSVAPVDSPVKARIVANLASEATSVVAISDLMIKLNRLVTRVLADADSVARVHRLSMNSPLEIILAGGAALAALVVFFKNVAETRLAWYQGTKAKYETEGLLLDNEQKRRNAQLEADADLRQAIEAEWTEAMPELLSQLSTLAMPVGLPESPERRALIESALAAIDLPAEVSADLATEADSASGTESH